MLETEEVDVDYFTPAASTSLSKIFSNTTVTEDGQENSSLKYIPPLPTQVTPKVEEEKTTKCVYVNSLFAYEWQIYSYISKEKVGFAIMKIIKTGLHYILLYDSNKTTLSHLTLMPNAEINIKENVSISFYDNNQKYWSVYTNQHELNEILNIIKKLNVCLKYSVDTEKCPTDKIDTENVNSQQTCPIITQQEKKNDKESDTDSSANRRTKDSILKRMATMGQSVLPSIHSIKAQTSDSSDTEAQNQHKTRHKPPKVINKRNLEKSIIEPDNKNEAQIAKITSKPISSPEINSYTFQNTEQQMVPIKTMDVLRNPVNIVSEANDTSLFMSEQRVNNSELRINISRMTDKLDLVLDKVKTLESVNKNYMSNSTSQFQNEITQKLLYEYERKIKSYEEFINSKGFHCDTFEPTENDKNVKESEICNCKVLCEEKDRQISELNEEVRLLSAKLAVITQENDESDLTKEINELKENIVIQNDQIDNLNKKLENTLSKEDVTNKIKSIMNETFQSISANFDNSTTYTGAVLKTTAASLIKKTTINCLKEFGT